MPRPSRSHRSVSLLAVFVLTGLTAIALVVWRSASPRTDGGDAGTRGVVSRGNQAVASECGSELATADPHSGSRRSWPESGGLEAAGTDDWLRPHRQTCENGRRLPTAASVASRPELDPSIADPPSIPVIPLPQIEPDRGLTQHADDREPAPPTIDWTSPTSLDSLGWEDLRLDQPQWPASPSLRAYLDRLADHPSAAKWAAEVEEALRVVEHRPLRDDSGGTLRSLQRLEFLSRQAHRMASVTWPLRVRADWLRAAYALERRVALWRQVATILQPDGTIVHRSDESGERGFEVLGLVRSSLERQPQPEAWFTYLRLPEVESALRGTGFQSPSQRSALARSVLTRMHSHLLSSTQRQFLSGAPFDAFETLLRGWVTEPIDYAQLVRDLELYELRRGSPEARRIAAAHQIARWSNLPSLQELGEQIAVHYRNANARVAIAAELVNHLLPQPPAFNETVDDEIAGTRVYGRSRATGRLRIFLVPDRRHWRLGLESQGMVRSETESSRGPARFFHDTDARFRAHKVVQVDHRGIRLWNSVVDADASPTLTGMETDFDSVPLLNVIARALVMQQYEMEEGSARSLMRRRVRERIASRFDEEIEKSLRELKSQFVTRFQRPMRKLELNPTPVELETTSTRLIARYRIAGDHQLASHTPRPQAPGDSVLSVQIHESTVNNILEQLHLDGRTVELKTLYGEMSRLFQGKAAEIPEDVPDGVQLKFAKQDAIRVQFGQDEITIVLALEELSHKKRAWRHFVVRATYRPRPDRLDPSLERAGYVRLKGRRLKIGDQVVLRGIFSKVFSRRPPVHLLGRQIGQDPRFAPFALSQYVVRGGWIGVALSPIKRGQRPQDMARSPSDVGLR